MERPGERLKGPPRDQCKDPQGARKNQSHCGMGLEEGGMRGTRSPCQAIVKLGKEQLGFNVGPSGVLVAGPEWTPDPLTAVPSAHGDRVCPQVPGANGLPARKTAEVFGGCTGEPALSKALQNSGELRGTPFRSGGNVRTIR